MDLYIVIAALNHTTPTPYKGMRYLTDISGIDLLQSHTQDDVDTELEEIEHDIEMTKHCGQNYERIICSEFHLSKS